MRVSPITPGTLEGCRVLVLDAQRNTYVNDLAIENEVFGPGVDVRLIHTDTMHSLADTALACDGIICWHLVALPAEALARLGQCRALVRAAVGVDNIDLAAARAQGLQVANVPDYGVEEVADHTLAMALALLRKVRLGDAIVRGGSWDWRELGELPRLRAMTMGIVGLGRIGTAVARRFAAFGCKVAFHDPYCPSGWEKSVGVERCESLHELLDRCDLISLHTPLTAETQALIGEAELRRLTGKYLMNTARGGLIEPKALARAISGRRLAGVALDVYADEANPPPVEMLAPEVLWSPHVAFYSNQALPELRLKAAHCLKALLLNQPHRNLL